MSLEQDIQAAKDAIAKTKAAEAKAAKDKEAAAKAAATGRAKEEAKARVDAQRRKDEALLKSMIARS
jgi:hypothetical protein